jgi:4'-phosphopantetheinyl transferase
MAHQNPPSEGCIQSFALNREEASYQGTLASVHGSSYIALKAQVGLVLHPSELNYFESLPAERRQISFLLGRYAAKRALQAYLNEADFAKINILSGVLKNPVICYRMDYPWGVSITHSDSMACALAFPMTHPMAVDVEEINSERVSVMATQCRESERNELEQLRLGTPAICTMLWTAKEAISKALQTGMTCPFDLFDVHSIIKLADARFQGLYKNFGQYKFHSWILGGFVLTIVMPRKTEIEFKAGFPSLPS